MRMRNIDASEGPISRRTVLRALGGAAAYAALGGCGDSNSGSNVPYLTNPQPIPSGTLVPSSIVVSNTGVGTIGPQFAGLSYDKLSMNLPRFTAQNSDLIGLFRRLGTSLLRIGGYSVDFVQWAPNGAGQTSGEVAPSDIDALAEFVQATDWNVLYSVNLAKSTPAAAAGEVAYAAKSLGNRLVGVELGNECNIYGAYGYFQNWNLQAFVQLWEQFRDAIVQAVPDVVMTGPASISDIGSWTIPFGQQVGRGQIALLTQHYYRGNGLSPTSTAAELISPDATLIDSLAQLNAGAASIGVPFRMSETNSFFDLGAIGVSDSYASSLWVIDYLFNVAIGGGVGVNLTGGGDTGGYTPIADNDGVVVEARPEYYGTLLFTLAGAGSLFGTSVSASGLNVTAYAVKSSQGGVNIVLVNKDSTQSLRVSIDCGQTLNSAVLLLMTAPSLDATSGVTIQGSGIASDGGFCPGAPYTLPVSGSTVSCYLGALSAALISVV